MQKKNRFFIAACMAVYEIIWIRGVRRWKKLEVKRSLSVKSSSLCRLALGYFNGDEAEKGKSKNGREKLG